MAARKTVTNKAVEEPAVAEEYVEDENWNGQIEGQEAIELEDTPKRRGRQVSALIVATREYEKAHKTAEKARDALAKVQPLADAAESASKAEAAAYEALMAVLGNR